MNYDVNEKLAEIFNKVFRLDTHKNSLEHIKVLQLGDPPWDSLKQIELLNEIEKEFKIQISLKCALKVRDWDSTYNLLEELRKKSDLV